MYFLLVLQKELFDLNKNIVTKKKQKISTKVDRKINIKGIKIIKNTTILFNKLFL